MRGVFLDTATVNQQDLDLSSLISSLPDWSLRNHTPANEVTGAIEGATIVVSNKVMLSRQILQGTSSLKLICVAATGTNNIDLDATREQGITVCNARGYATTSVVEHVFSVMLAFSRQSVRYQRAVQEGRWHSSDVFCLHDYPINELAGQTLGIVGHGELGSAVANMARAFGMHAERVEKEELHQRVQSLEGQVDRMKSLLTLEDSDLAEMQQAATPAGSSTCRQVQP